MLLIDAGVPLLPMDGLILECFASAVHQARTPAGIVEKEGTVLQGPTGKTPSTRARGVMARKQALELAKDLGLTPASRARLSIELPTYNIGEFGMEAIEAALCKKRPRDARAGTRIGKNVFSTSRPCDPGGSHSQGSEPAAMPHGPQFCTRGGQNNFRHSEKLYQRARGSSS